jgi:hypothetical protein
MTQDELENRFSYHAPDEEKADLHANMRSLFGQVAGYINRFMPESREKSVVITKLEEAMFWTNAGIARN